MEEIKVRRNPLGIKVFISNRIDLETIPKEDFDLFISSLTEIVIERLCMNNK